jgi:hypothetical protein
VPLRRSGQLDAPDALGGPPYGDGVMRAVA